MKPPVPRIIRGDGTEVSFGESVFPIFLEMEVGLLKVIGSGFFLSRYGAFASAAHVFEDYGDNGRFTHRFIVPQFTDQRCIMRLVRSVDYNSHSDIAIGQADNFLDRYPTNPLKNLMGTIDLSEPSIGDELFTLGYPKNPIFDLRIDTRIELSGSEHVGSIVGVVGHNQHYSLKLPHLDANLLIESGASGSPVFSRKGLIGIASRGWEFLDDGEALSHVTLIALALDMPVNNLMVPAGSWEHSQMIAGEQATLRKLIEWGHVRSRM